ncbi:hypothetical protein QT972_20200 [Microcoleus sp. herbarium7]|uniref:hypothetical protein n=1 Tax=Microcoleus sp. herbarium7 TaxID=3055435 RepID=UPI002FD36C93
MTDRLQLNLRLDGRRDLLETVKETAASEGLSVNAWVIKVLERATPAQGSIATPDPIATQEQEAPKDSAPLDIEPVLDKLLDKKLDTLLASKLANFEERLGKLRA